MCNVCCKEFSGWCKAFTKTEVFLSILEGLLLIIFIVLLVFVILHLTICAKLRAYDKPVNIKTDVTVTTEANGDTETVTPTEHIQDVVTRTLPTHRNITTMEITEYKKTSTIMGKLKEKCTWKPEKTEAVTHYYLKNEKTPTPNAAKGDITSGLKAISFTGSSVSSKSSDGDEAEILHKQITLALVKVNPPHEIIFGCILTIVAARWTVTAASCVEAIEEVDSLDSFVMLEGYGEVVHGNMHAVSDVQIHPWYQHANRSYDVVALRSADGLLVRGARPVELPTALDYLLVTIGEAFTVLGYGSFRSTGTGASGRSLHRVQVLRMPWPQCPRATDVCSTRDPLPAGEVPHGACALTPLCAGVLLARSTPCNYCAGAPLLRQAILFGLMANNEQCNVACEPNVYVNMAAITDWLQFVMSS